MLSYFSSDAIAGVTVYIGVFLVSYKYHQYLYFIYPICKTQELDETRLNMYMQSLIEINYN